MKCAHGLGSNNLLMPKNKSNYRKKGMEIAPNHALSTDKYPLRLKSPVCHVELKNEKKNDNNNCSIDSSSCLPFLASP